MARRSSRLKQPMEQLLDQEQLTETIVLAQTKTAKGKKLTKKEPAKEKKLTKKKKPTEKKEKPTKKDQITQQSLLLALPNELLVMILALVLPVHSIDSEYILQRKIISLRSSGHESTESCFRMEHARRAKGRSINILLTCRQLGEVGTSVLSSSRTLRAECRFKLMYPGHFYSPGCTTTAQLYVPILAKEPIHNKQTRSMGGIPKSISTNMHVIRSMFLLLRHGDAYFGRYSRSFGAGAIVSKVIRDLDRLLISGMNLTRLDGLLEIEPFDPKDREELKHVVIEHFKQWKLRGIRHVALVVDGFTYTSFEEDHFVDELTFEKGSIKEERHTR